MLNRKYFPFERNSYYSGKLLTAWDFEAEQRYFNDKRRFINRLTGANGILAGLGVIRGDDSSVILQAGCALDASGREIVVEETKMIKLSTVEGYGDLETGCAYLGISYNEKPDDEVYSVMNGDSGEARHNKILEGYRLTLLDEQQVARVSQELDEFVQRTVLYADHDVEVVQLTPAFLPRGGNLMIRIQVSRISAGSGEYSFACTLDTPGFLSPENLPSMSIAVNNLQLAHGESKTLEYVFVPEAYLWGGAGCVINVTNFTFRRGEESFEIKNNFEVSIRPVDQELTDFYLSKRYSRAMDKILSESYDEKLWIAKILFIRTNTSLLIDSVLPPPYAQYSYSAQQLMTLRRLEEYYPSAEGGVTIAPPQIDFGHQTVQTETAAPDMMRYTASGSFNLSIGMQGEQKEPAFSQEIMHGLGKGAVYVEVGVEYITSDDNIGDSSEIIMGDVSIFGEDKAADPKKAYNLSTAVKVLPERGTFVVGVKLKAPTDLIGLQIRWYAFKVGEVGDKVRPRQDGERMLIVNPDTIILNPKGTAHISPVFINMPSEPCKFEVDPESGTIDQSGLYTAPARAGAYEIKVSAMSDPTVYTHVFAIVTQKKKDE